MKMKSVLSTAIAGLSLAGLLFAAAPKEAHAHATSIGFENGGTFGTVNIWLGTYDHSASSHHLEGSMRLQGLGGSTYDVTLGFTMGAGVGPTPVFDGTSASPAATKPGGLIDGVTNFYAPNLTVGDSSPLIGFDPGLAGGVNHWQGAQFTGLTAGDYLFTWIPSGSASAEWSPLNTNMNGSFTLEGEVIGVPEPGMAAVLGLGLLGLGVARRKRAA